MPSTQPASKPQGTSSPQGKKLLDQVRDSLRVKHYSYRTEQTYVEWIRRFILFHNKRHPAEMGTPEIEAFITHLAVERNVAVSTQNQAISAILFLYKYVLNRELEMPPSLVRPGRPTIASGVHASCQPKSSHKLPITPPHLLRRIAPVHQ